MKKNLLVPGFLCICVFILIGCRTLTQSESLPKQEALLESSPMLKFSDVPIPVGFKLMPTESYSFESTGFRAGLLKYKGKGNPDSVVNFFKEQMPMYNWCLINTVEYGQRILNFDREQESCIINLLPKGNSITITISIGPKSSLPKKTETIK